ncbi:dithiol glutaredoxin [Martiniozyma asiatica (nom. inval.)]|nr:dithiol glutaredoxin [Martiniozyma asiatica]
MQLAFALLILLLLFKVFSVFKRSFSATSRVMSAQTVSQVKELINSKTVFVASKTYCPYCSSAKRLLEKAYPDAYILELDTIEDGDDIQAALQSISGQRTVPNIYIKGKHIGGNSDLQALGEKKIKELVA